MGLASLFTVPAAAVRIILRSNAPMEPAGQFAKTLDLGLGTIKGFQPGAHVLQPHHIGLNGLLAQGQFGVLLFPK